MSYPDKRVMSYIDGFNLYYGALRDRPYRWPDLEALCRRYIKPGFVFVGAKYFTAKLKDRPENGAKESGSDSICGLCGRFQTSKPSTASSWCERRFGSSRSCRNITVPATPACDPSAFTRRRDQTFVRDAFNPVGIINPHADRRRSFALSPHELPEGSFYQRIKPKKLRECQLPLELEDEEGAIHCPDGWSDPLKSREPPGGGSASQATAKQPEVVRPA